MLSLLVRPKAIILSGFFLTFHRNVIANVLHEIFLRNCPKRKATGSRILWRFYQWRIQKLSEFVWRHLWVALKIVSYRDWSNFAIGWMKVEKKEIKSFDIQTFLRSFHSGVNYWTLPNRTYKGEKSPLAMLSYGTSLHRDSQVNKELCIFLGVGINHAPKYIIWVPKNNVQ